MFLAWTDVITENKRETNLDQENANNQQQLAIQNARKDIVNKTNEMFTNILKKRSMYISFSSVILFYFLAKYTFPVTRQQVSHPPRDRQRNEYTSSLLP